MVIKDQEIVEYAVARESEQDPGSLAVYGGVWTPFRDVAEGGVTAANLHMPIDPPGAPWTLWTRTRSTTGVREVA
jgi:hypothetical protein